MPLQVLERHWSRNGVPRPPVQHHLPHVPGSSPGPTHLPQTAHPTPAQTRSAITIRPVDITPVPTRLQPTPAPSTAPQVHPVKPFVPSSAPMVFPIPIVRPPDPHFRLTGDPHKHGSWAPNWQKFIELARTHALNDLVLTHGFPTPFSLRNQAGEALASAWMVYHRNTSNEPLCNYACEFFFHFSLMSHNLTIH